jgi:hypothetical protein
MDGSFIMNDRDGKCTNSFVRVNSREETIWKNHRYEAVSVISRIGAAHQ